MNRGLPAKHYVDSSGRYIGAFAGYIDGDGKRHEPAAPAGGIEVQTLPPHGTCTWDGSKWSDPPARHPSAEVELVEIKQRLAALEAARVR